MPAARSENAKFANHAVPASLPYVRMSSPLYDLAAAARRSSPGASRSPPRYGSSAPTDSYGERMPRPRVKRAGHMPAVGNLARRPPLGAAVPGPPNTGVGTDALSAAEADTGTPAAATPARRRSLRASSSRGSAPPPTALASDTASRSACRSA
eukprot:scaffold14758_cov130-Isochrysis_galbana.AAC.5